MAQKLLLADDSVTIQRVIELTFADENIDVVAVSDGDQAIARIDADPPDIVLADIGMPGRDGYEVAAHIKHDPRLSHIPVVLLTGAFEPVDQARAAEVGSNGVLAKPFEPQLVIARVKELLASPPAPVEGGSVPSADRPVPSRDAPLSPPTQAISAPGEQLDAYFDRLDAAFAGLSSPRQAPAAPHTDAAPAVPDIDWFAAQPSPSVPDGDLPLSYASPAPQVQAAEPPAQPPATYASPAPAAALPSVPAAVPPLADAFAAILAAEQADPGATPAAWPATPTEISDSFVDEVARRVLGRMSDRIVRETVSSVAERLVRDEIERIKASIK